jgi:hypothetical protein
VDEYKPTLMYPARPGRLYTAEAVAAREDEANAAPQDEDATPAPAPSQQTNLKIRMGPIDVDEDHQETIEIEPFRSVRLGTVSLFECQLFHVTDSRR